MATSNAKDTRRAESPTKSGPNSNASAEQKAEQRRRAMQDADFARDAERRRNGLGAAPVRTEKPSSPATPGNMGPSKKRAKKRLAAGRKAAPAVRAAPVADRGVDRRQALPKIAPAYMLSSPADLKRDRQSRKAKSKKEAERPAKKVPRTTKTP
ncbi:hypothetical protein ABZ467_22925 [Streptomyces sp. NPDC005727]|uniref:hypothetical protein n=1 Tax=Streptomyces sp. NPDC005727 TaxID=3157053 RepID=UPI0033EDC3CA